MQFSTMYSFRVTGLSVSMTVTFNVENLSMGIPVTSRTPVESN